jgi:hypothetical protein
MTIPMGSQEPEPEVQRRVDGRTLWSGGVATAVVAALIALVGILVCRWLFTIPILAPKRDGAWGAASTAGYVFASAAVALFATALMHLLLLSTPRPQTFFTWIIGLATVIAVVFPFSTTAPLSQKAATAPGDPPRLPRVRPSPLTDAGRRVPLTAAAPLALPGLDG